MSLPGPDVASWAVELLLIGVAFVIVGEGIRLPLSRHLPLLQSPNLLERGLVDFYLGGAAVFVLAWLPFETFYAATVPILAATSLVGTLAARRRAVFAGLRTFLRSGFLDWPATVVVLLTGAVVYAVGLGAVQSLPAGNTWDASVISVFSSLMIEHHGLALNLAPVAQGFLTYPQGAIVWFGTAQLLGGLPAARTAILVTPLFFAMAPIGAYCLGRRIFRATLSAVLLTLTVGLLGSWSRLLVSGSYDFVLAFPLILLLAGWATEWKTDLPPSWRNAATFGGMSGFAAAINPVGTEWLFLLLPTVAALAPHRFGGQPRVWWARWCVAVGTSLVFVIPNLAGIAWNTQSGIGSGFGIPPVHPTPAGGLIAQFVGSTDPFYLNSGSVLLSPFPIVRSELVLLLSIGVIVFLVPALRRTLVPGSLDFFRWCAGSVVASFVLVGVSVSGQTGLPISSTVAAFTSGAQAAILVFTTYTAIAAIPIIVVANMLWQYRWHQPSIGRSVGQRRVRTWTIAGTDSRSVLLACVFAAAAISPGIAILPGAFPQVVGELSHPFGNATNADFALLDWASSNLPAGSRVLVAPGSALQFLPGYNIAVVVVFPMLGGVSANGSYRLIVNELTNGTLDSAGVNALAALHVDYIGVTQANSVLWPAFNAAPLWQQPGLFPVVFHQGDAVLFARR